MLHHIPDARKMVREGAVAAAQAGLEAFQQPHGRSAGSRGNWASRA